MIRAHSKVIGYNKSPEPMHFCTFSPRKTDPISPMTLPIITAVFTSSDRPLTTGAIVSSLAPIDQALYSTKATRAISGSKAHPYIEKPYSLKD